MQIAGMDNGIDDDDTHDDIPEFHQNTFAAAAKHPLLFCVIQRVASELQGYRDEEFETMESIGSRLWSTAIYEYLHETYEIPDHMNILQNMHQPHQIDDIVILPCTAMGYGKWQEDYNTVW